MKKIEKGKGKKGGDLGYKASRRKIILPLSDRMIKKN